MKKKKHNRTMHTLKSIFNVREWMDYDRLKSFSKFLSQGAKTMFVPQSSEKKEKTISFAAMAKQMNLTDDMLKARSQALYRLSLLMCFLATCIAIYCAYHIFLGNIAAAILSFIVMLIALSLACRYHFWYFQIKKRKLGCTFKEWYREGLLGYR